MSPPDGSGAERIRHLVEMAEEVTAEPPRPLMREMPPADPFPVDTLGDVLAPAARAIHNRIRAPLAVCGQSVLAAATFAAQAHADVELPIGVDQAKPLSGYFVTVAATGERKSACDSQAGSPIRKREATLREAYAGNLPPYEDDKAAWEKAREFAIRSGKGDRVKIRDALDAVGLSPVPPLTPVLTCSEPTFEGLCKLFAGGPPSLGIFAPEGGQFIGGHGMNDENKLRTAAGLSSLWDGEPIRRVRGGDGAVVLPGRRLTAHLMAQPAVADMLFRDRLLAEQGLLSRMMISAPDSASGTRFWRDEDPGTDRALNCYCARVLQMLEAPLPLADGKINELQPRRLPLSPAARQLWINFADHVERAIGTGGELEPIRGLANKLPEHAARLAGVLTLVRSLHAADISSDEMGAGIALAEHYAAEALRLFGTSGISGNLRLAQRLLDWLLTSWGEPVISLVEIYQRGPNSIRDAATAKRMVGILEDHGWLTKIPQGAVVARQRRRDAWRIIRG